MVLAHIVMPSCSTSCRAGNAIVHAVGQVHRSYALKPLVRDDVVAEHVQIFLYHGAQIRAQLLGVGNEVGVDVVLQSADAIIVLYESATGGFLHHVEHMLTVAHTVKEGRQGAQVLRASAQEEQVVVYTLQLVHDGTDVMYSVRELYAHGLFYHTHQSVAVVHGAQIVETVCQGECLRIGHALHHLLYAAVYVAQVRIDVLHGLAVEHRLQSQHTVRRGVVRTEVHHKVVVIKESVARLHQFAQVVEVPLRRVVALRLIGHGEPVVLRAHVIVLAQRITHKVIAQEESSHVGMTEKLNAQEVEHLALHQVAAGIQMIE